MELKLEFLNIKDAETFVKMLWEYYSFLEDLDSSLNLNANDALDLLHDVFGQVKHKVNLEVSKMESWL